MVQQQRAPVLLVEDDPDTRDSMKFVLEADQHPVVTAANGQEALDTLHQGVAPCVILLDLMMPVMDGMQFRQEQLKDPELATIPVVAYSGHHDVAANVRQLHPAAYLRKPVDPEVLLELVNSHCDKC